MPRLTLRSLVIAAALVGSALAVLAPEPAVAGRRKRAKQAAAATAPAATAPAAASQGAAPTVLVAEQATGSTTYLLRMSPAARLGGASLVLTWDPARYLVLEPRPADALRGYMCQSNFPQPGELRWSCVGLVGEPRGGDLATVEVKWREAAPTPGALQLAKVELVDDAAAPLAAPRVELALADALPSR